MKEGQRVLEIGCGPGFFTVPAAEIVGSEGSVDAIDINPVTVNYVMKKVENSSIDNVTVGQADAAKTGFPAEEFDLIFVFGLARSKGGALDQIWKEANRVLEPDGTLSVEGRVNPPGDLFKRAGGAGRIEKFLKVNP